MGGLARDRRQGPAEEAVQGERGAGRTRRVDRGVRGDEGVGLVVHDGGPGGGHLVAVRPVLRAQPGRRGVDRKSTRLNSSHPSISYAVFCLKKKKKNKKEE